MVAAVNSAWFRSMSHRLAQPRSGRRADGCAEPAVARRWQRESRSAGTGHGRETRHGVLFGVAILLDHGVDGGYHAPPIGSAHPIGDGRSVRTQFGRHGLAFAHGV